MKNLSTKITYIVIGSLLTLIGYHFGSVENNSAVAQRDDPIVDEIQCRKLVIVGEDNTSRIVLMTNDSDRGHITIYNEDRVNRMSLGCFINKDSGFIRISGKESGGTAAQLSVDEYGGHIALWNKLLDTPVFQSGITGNGNGYAATYDKTGYQTKSIGFQGAVNIKRKIRESQ